MSKANEKQATKSTTPRYLFAPFEKIDIFSHAKFMRKAFTLVEVLITILIIGILVTVSLASYSSALANQRDTTRLTDMHSIANALGQYYLDKKSYPVNIASPIFNASFQLDGNVRTINGCTGTGSTLVPNYLSSVPEDPRNKNNLVKSPGAGQDCSISGTQNGQYLYSAVKSNTTGINGYILGATMEKDKNKNSPPIPTEASVFNSISANYYLQPKTGL